MKNRKAVFIIPVVVAILSSILVFLGIYNMWFGEVREGIMLFCENARDGFIKQPSNTFSNIGFIVIGLYVGWLAFKNDFSTKNKMTQTLFYPSIFSSIVVFLGPGSMAMHASNGSYGGFTDLFSMFLLSGFTFSYAITRYFKLPKLIFNIILIICVSFCSWLFWQPFNKLDFILNITEIFFASFLLLAAVFELMNKYLKGNKINASSGYWSIFTLLLAFFIWNISRTQDSWWCNPDSLIQGHAVWHLLCALAAFFLFRFYVSEEIE